MRVTWNTTWNLTQYSNVDPSTLATCIGQRRVNSLITSDGQLIKDVTQMLAWINAQPSGDDTIWASVAGSWRSGPPSALGAPL